MTMKRLLSRLLIFTMLIPVLLSAFPIWSLPVAAAGETYAVTRTLVSIDFNVAGDNTNSGTDATLDGRVSTGSNVGAPLGNRHRLFFMSFDFSDLKNRLDEFGTLKVGLRTNTNGSNNSDSKFRIYFLPQEFAQKINSTDIRTYGDARNLGLVDYADEQSMVLDHTSGLSISSFYSSDNFIDKVREYFMQYPDEDFISFKVVGTAGVAIFETASNNNADNSGRPYRPHIEFTPSPDLEVVHEAGQALEDYIPQVTSNNLTLPSSLPEYPGVSITWESLKPEMISDSGELLSTPGFYEESATVSMKASVTYGSTTRQFTYDVKVLRNGSYVGLNEDIDSDKADISFSLYQASSELAGYLLNIPNTYLNVGEEYTLYSTIAAKTEITRFIPDTTGEYTLINVSDYVGVNAASFSVESKSGGINPARDIFILDGIDSEIKHVVDAVCSVELGDLSAVTSDLILPDMAGDVPLEWKSSNIAALGDNGRVDRPFSGEGDARVELAVTGSKGTYTYKRIFLVIILRQEGSVGFPELKDPNHITDAQFFGVWNVAQDRWSTIPYLRYDLFPALNEVSEQAKKGDYTKAKEELLVYYRNRDTVAPYKLPTSNNFLSADMMAEKIFGWMQVDNVQGVATIGPEWQRYTVNLNVGSSVHKTYFLIESEMDGSAIEVYSKEHSGGTYGATLDIVVDGVNRSFKVAADTYISAGDNVNENYGDEEILYARESADFTSDPRGANPFGTETRRPYFYFNTGDITGSISSIQLSFYARSDSGSDKKVFVFNSGNFSQGFPTANDKEGNVVVDGEHNVSWKLHYPFIFNFKQTGYLWDSTIQSRWNLEGEWQNYGTRMYPMEWLIGRYRATGNELFAYRALEFWEALYRQQPGATYPRALEGGWRTEFVCILFFGTLNSASVTPELLTAQLKYAYAHASALPDVSTAGAFNQVMAMLCGGLRTIGYFPEIQIDGKWETAKRKIKELYDNQLNPDGSYAEATSGYISGVATELRTALELVILSDGEGDYYYDAFLDYYRKLVRYMFDMCMPYGLTIPWGDGGRSNNKSFAYTQAQTFPALDPDLNFEYFYTEGATGNRPNYNSKLYPDKAIAFLRSGWLPDDFGATISSNYGGSHNHPDDLSLDVFAYGSPLLIEAGAGSYTGNDPMAPVGNRTFSHNTIEVDKKSQNTYDYGSLTVNQPQKLLMASNDIFDFVDAGSEKIYVGLDMNRKVLFLHNSYWIVSDYITPNDNQPHRYRQVWRPDVRNFLTIDPDTKAATTHYVKGPNIQIIPADPEKSVARSEKSYVTNTATGPENTDYVSYTRENVSGSQTFDTVLYPDRQGNKTYVSVERIPLEGLDTIDATALKIDIGLNTGYYYSSNEYNPGKPISALPCSTNCKLYPGSGSNTLCTYHRYNSTARWVPTPAGTLSTREFGKYSTDGQMAYAEENSKGEITVIALTKATSLKQNGKDIVLAGEMLEDLGIKWSLKTMNISTQNGLLPESGLSIHSSTPVDKVTLNGTEINFEYKDNAVLINGASVPVISPTPSPAPGSNSSSGMGNPSGNSNTSNPSVSSSGGGGGGGGSISGGGTVSNVPSQTATPTPDALPEQTPPPESTAKPPAETMFNDLSGHWAKDEIFKMYEQNIVNGNDEGMFLPDDDITRAEFVAILARALNLSGGSKTFSDVSDDDWFAAAVAGAAEAGLVGGYADGTFAPNNTISRQEMAKILIAAAEFSSVPLTDTPDGIEMYGDFDQISDWAEQSVAQATHLGLMKGNDNNFEPLGKATRAQAVVVVSRLLGIIGDISGQNEQNEQSNQAEEIVEGIIGKTEDTDDDSDNSDNNTNGQSDSEQ